MCFNYVTICIAKKSPGNGIFMRHGYIMITLIVCVCVCVCVSVCVCFKKNVAYMKHKLKPLLLDNSVPQNKNGLIVF